jgi:hypothetical protein
LPFGAIELWRDVIIGSDMRQFFGDLNALLCYSVWNVT